MTAAVDGGPEADASAADARPLAIPDQQTGAEIAVRRTSLNEKLIYARELAESGLLPAAFRAKPANVLYAIEYGEMLRLAPMAALTGIHVIEGKPTASSALMSALVRRAGHRLRISGNDTRAVVQIVRSDDPEFTFESVWTMDRARQAGIAGKAVWKNYPAAMLKARAISECARDACEEALSGLLYTPEELGVEVNEDGQVIQAGPEIAVNAPAVDWDAEIAKVVDDPEALRALWKRAPRDSDARQRIAAAAGAAAQRKVHGDVVDAEVVEDADDAAATAATAARVTATAHVEHAREVNVRVADLFDRLAECDSKAAVDALIESEIAGKPVADVDVTGLLSGDDLREVLDLGDGTWTLAAFAAKVAGYVEPRGYSVATAMGGVA